MQVLATIFQWEITSRILRKLPQLHLGDLCFARKSLPKEKETSSGSILFTLKAPVQMVTNITRKALSPLELYPSANIEPIGIYFIMAPQFQKSKKLNTTKRVFLSC